MYLTFKEGITNNNVNELGDFADDYDLASTQFNTDLHITYG